MIQPNLTEIPVSRKFCNETRTVENAEPREGAHVHITSVKNLEDDYDVEMEFSLTASIGERSSPNDFIHEITGRILASAEDEDPEQCGLLQAYLIQFDQAEACGIDTWDVGDAVCGTVATYWEALFDVEAGAWRPDIQGQHAVTSRNLLIVDYIEVNPKFRGHKIPAASVERLIDLFGAGCAVVACIPTPVQFLPAFADDLPRRQVTNCSEREDLKKLQDYWLQAGFRPYKETGIYLKKAQRQD